MGSAISPTLDCNNYYVVSYLPYLHVVADLYNKYSLSRCMLFKYTSLFKAHSYSVLYGGANVVK